MQIYMNAMTQCWDTLKAKHKAKGIPAPQYSDFAYFCFHTPFSKMVQKAFYALVLKEAQTAGHQFPAVLVAVLASEKFKNTATAQKALAEHMGSEWKSKCERGLHLAK